MTHIISVSCEFMIRNEDISYVLQLMYKSFNVALLVSEVILLEEEL